MAGHGQGLSRAVHFALSPPSACTPATSLEPQSPLPSAPQQVCLQEQGHIVQGSGRSGASPPTTSRPCLHPGCALTPPSHPHALLPSPSQPLGSGFDPCPKAGRLYSKAFCPHFL